MLLLPLVTDTLLLVMVVVEGALLLSLHLIPVQQETGHDGRRDGTQRHQHEYDAETLYRQTNTVDDLFANLPLEDSNRLLLLVRGKRQIRF